VARFWTRTAIRRFSIIILKMFPKLFFEFFWIFELGQQFCTSGELFIIISFFLIFFYPFENISLAAFSVHLYIKIRRFSIIILKMFPKLFFDFFSHFWTQTAILYKWWIFHNYRIFPSYFLVVWKIFEKCYGRMEGRKDIIANILTGFKFKTWPI